MEKGRGGEGGVKGERVGERLWEEEGTRVEAAEVERAVPGLPCAARARVGVCALVDDRRRRRTGGPPSPPLDAAPTPPYPRSGRACPLRRRCSGSLLFYP